MSVEGHRHDQYSQTDHTHSAAVLAAHASSHAAAGSDPVTLAESQVTNLTTDLATLTTNVTAAAPAGAVSMFAGSSAPSGWFVCDGSEKPIATYGALYTILGTTYGALTNGSGGVGTTHFRLPDLRGRAVVGVGTGAGLTARTLAATGGAEAVTLTAAQSGVPAHSHPNTLAAEAAHTHANTLAAEAAHTHSIAHEHTITVGAGSSTTQRISAPASFSSTASLASQTTISASTSGAGSSHNHTITNAAGSSHNHTITNANNTAAAASSSHENMQPFMALNFIIKY